MTIASALDALNTDIQNARTAITNKGGTVTANGGSSQLATDIATIPSGGSAPVITSLNVTPTTSAQTITAPSGTDGYSPVNVSAVTSNIDNNITAGNIKKNVQILGVTGSYEGSSSIGITREVKNGVYQIPTENFTFSLPSDATDVGGYALYYAFNNCDGLTSVDLSSLTTISGNYALYYTFYGCDGLTSVDLSSLTTVSGGYALYYAFNGCTGLTSVDLSSLTTVSGGYSLHSVFYGCTALTSVDLSSLTTVSGSSGLRSAFNGCTALTSVDLSSLTTVSGGYCLSSAFSNCRGLTDIYFRALTTTSFGTNKNQFSSMLSSTGTSTTHTIHFPSNLSSTISTLTGYPLFGGTRGYVTLSFDLPATS